MTLTPNQPTAESEADAPGRYVGYDRSLDVQQGFDFRLDRQSAIGFLVSLTIGGTQIQPEFGMVDPTLLGIAPATAIAATGANQTGRSLGPLSQVAWELGDTDPIEFQARISARAKQQIMLVQYAQNPVVDVTVAWVIYEYDEVAKKYYVAFSNSAADAGGAPAKGQLLKQGRNLELEVESGAATEVESPRNYVLRFSMVPKDNLTQTLYLATGALLRIQKPWGRVKA